MNDTPMALPPEPEMKDLDNSADVEVAAENKLFAAVTKAAHPVIPTPFDEKRK